MGTCPRRGYLWFTNSSYEKLPVQATCKTWKCPACRKALVKKFAERLEYGCLTLGSSWLITLTLKLGDSSKIKDAVFVRKALERFWVRLKIRPNWKQVVWLKVIELTKKGQPHLHIVVGNITGTHRQLQLEAREAWLFVTGDSYIVDVRPVSKAKEIGHYLGKYLAKGYAHREKLEALGFNRRWSASRGWPRVGPRTVVDKKGEILTLVRYESHVMVDEKDILGEGKLADIRRSRDRVGDAMDRRREQGIKKARIKKARLQDALLLRSEPELRSHNISGSRPGSSIGADS